MSLHETPVIQIETILKHPNADKLELIQVFGWTCCVRKDQFKIGDLAVYIPPDYIVDSARPEFAFLATGKTNSEVRIKVKKLRQIYSQGLLIAAPDGVQLGDNAIDILGIKRWQPHAKGPKGEKILCGDALPDPSGIVAPKYDVENYHRYNNELVDGEEIMAFEKIHGVSARFLFHDNQMWVGTRNFWRKESEQSDFWKCLKQNPWIEKFCKDNPGLVLYGEIFGQVQDLKYGAGPGQFFFAAFDIRTQGYLEGQVSNWVDYEESRKMTEKYPDFKWVPLIYRGPFDGKMLLEMSDKLNSQWPVANHLAEGLVVKPIKERYSNKVGRVQLKMVSNRYLERD
jgi:RNA ligase (TIGR02306 family)